MGNCRPTKILRVSRLCRIESYQIKGHEKNRFGGSDQCVADVDQEFVQDFDNGLPSLLAGEKLKHITGKYQRPAKVNNIVVPQINCEIFLTLNPDTRNVDYRM